MKQLFLSHYCFSVCRTMASSLSPSKLHINAYFFCLILISMISVFVSSFEFRVGGETGAWMKPTGNETETYNEWATRNRFHVGDSLYFKYQNDSVLVVDRTSYINCSVSNPIFKFEDGDTVFQFDRYGFFYFISGQPSHCEAGQRLIVRVMVHPAHADAAVDTPQPAPSPKGDGSDGGDIWDAIFGPSSFNSTVKLSVASYFMTALGGMLVVLYLLM